ncbi:MAG: CBS domain-containing protein [Anaerolineaceae bacterium]|nr:CBS domain-containing protein [Anaerolineaceae bacterium]
MLIVSEILRAKGHEVYWVDPDTSLLSALELMAEKGIGALLVKKDGNAVGIFSERDFARLVAREQKIDLRLPVDTVMTKDVFCVSLDETVDECMALMTTQRLRHLPVCDQNSIVGIISIGDVVKSLIEDKDLLIKNMEEYILGRGFGK